MIRRTFITFVMLSGVLSAFVYTLLIAYNTSVLFVGGRQVALVDPPVLEFYRDPLLTLERPRILEEEEEHHQEREQYNLEPITLDGKLSSELRDQRDLRNSLQLHQTHQQQEDAQQMLAGPLQQIVVRHHHLLPKQRHHRRHLLRRRRRQQLQDEQHFVIAPSSIADYNDNDIKALPSSHSSSLSSSSSLQSQSSQIYSSSLVLDLSDPLLHTEEAEGAGNKRTLQNDKPFQGFELDPLPLREHTLMQEQSVPNQETKRQQAIQQKQTERLKQTNGHGYISRVNSEDPRIYLRNGSHVQISRSLPDIGTDRYQHHTENIAQRSILLSKLSLSSPSSSSSSSNPTSTSSPSKSKSMPTSFPAATSNSSPSLSPSLPLRPPSTLLPSSSLAVKKGGNVVDVGDSGVNADRTGSEEEHLDGGVSRTNSSFAGRDSGRTGGVFRTIRKRLKTKNGPQEPNSMSEAVRTETLKHKKYVNNEVAKTKKTQGDIDNLYTNIDNNNNVWRDGKIGRSVVAAAGDDDDARDGNTVVIGDSQIGDQQVVGEEVIEEGDDDEKEDEDDLGVEGDMDTGEGTADRFEAEQQTGTGIRVRLEDPLRNRVHRGREDYAEDDNDDDDDDDDADQGASPFRMMPALPRSSKIITIREAASKKLPQAIIIGVKKGGTRALLEFLRLHPDIRAPGPEPHFFDRHYNKGLEWYRSKMPLTIEGQISMEKTPSYFVTRDVPRRIYNMSKKVKLIVVVRDPVTRSISDYTQTMSKRRTVRPFEHMVFVNNNTRIVDTSWGAIRIGVYAKHLELWLKYFPLSQMHFVSGEKLITDPAGEMALLQDFLGLKRIINEKHFFFNETKGFPCLKKPEGSGHPHCLGKTKGRQHPAIDPKVIQRLRDFYRPFNAKFYEMAHRDFEWP